MATIAVIFDFDDTIVPDSTTKLLQKHGVDTKIFWERDVKALVDSGYETTLAYLRILLKNIGKDKPLGLLTNNVLRSFGEELEKEFYPGLPELIHDLKHIVAELKDIQIEFYIISGGLQEVIEGSKLIQENFSAVYASQLAGDNDDEVLKYIKRCITFTEKTRYLFEINKGIEPEKTKKNPYLVNTNVDLDKRRIPLKNTIYIGDGLTDIPCFSVVGKAKGYAFGIFDPTDTESTKRRLIQLLAPKRVLGLYAPEYGPNDALGSLIRVSVACRCGDIKLEQELALGTETPFQ